MKLALFNGKEIRRIMHNNEWWFSVIDVVEAIADTDRGRKYWSDLKAKIVAEGYTEVSEKIGQLKLPAPDRKKVSTKGNYLGWGGDLTVRSNKKND
ncbi:MAG: hypothetical protein ACOCXQ_02935 [Patescibacteria group bacterium]